jgi:antibiotic biosynthesis monooxygenase (ABM) superfamily enzyme
MIVRMWHGWTRPENADAYETLLKNEIIPGIAARKLPGYIGLEVLRRNGDEETEFVTITRFESMDGVRAFAGDSPANAVIHPKAHALLLRFREQARHYEVRSR